MVLTIKTERLHGILKKPLSCPNNGVHPRFFFFAELNRNRPSIRRFDFVTYAITPQVHVFDNISLVENLSAQLETVKSTRHFVNQIGIHISSVNLKL